MQPNRSNDLESTDVPRLGGPSLVTVVALVVMTAMVGGYACGLAINRFGELGSASLWLLGAGAGYATRKAMAAPSRPVGFALAIACGVALLIAETCWIRWNTVQGAESWWTAFTMLIVFVQEYEISALLGAVFTAFGAVSAYRQTAVRYRMVPVE